MAQNPARKHWVFSCIDRQTNLFALCDYLYHFLYSLYNLTRVGRVSDIAGSSLSTAFSCREGTQRLLVEMHRRSAIVDSRKAALAWEGNSS
jgi:hypothetical protein